ncbi:MAG: hypothetical protein A3A97_00560 [Candidatus Terrybacteria bacterium RIFCSPLOWO2_01_FULL_40_23]|uniref:Corrinoid adenosyltransferase n=1 Tax=Candidatus Terrybacteria bacterium RIFCSPLOWO2_01_FULL_40_23 TaxID=1802366 RepID=A0A1G2PTM4_9BACT|nr:MAG: hypothetical protein A3A97_00560 [Candidatus Terrybacteria bacterium RIFCSPLOWO2_01_FULL_40_23]
MPQLNAFILPSGSSAVTNLHLARNVVRRAERTVLAANVNDNPLLIKFLNRSSSLLFSVARWLNQKEGNIEKILLTKSKNKTPSFGTEFFLLKQTNLISG